MQKDPSFKNRKTEIKDREEDATSSDTLEDIEDEENISSNGDASDIPSPDGALDDESELDDADPM